MTHKWAIILDFVLQLGTDNVGKGISLKNFSRRHEFSDWGINLKYYAAEKKWNQAHHMEN